MFLLKKHPNLVATVILAFLAVISVTVSWQESTTMDERAHIPSAYSYVRYGDMRLNPEHPPLLKDLAGLAILPLTPAFPVTDPAWTEGVNEQWVLGDKFLHESGNSADAITFWARLPILAVALLLGVALYLWTRRLAGTAAGLLALTLYAFDPNVIAHDHYVTTDIGIAAFIFFATYFFVRFLQEPTGRNVVLAGLFLGLVQLAKFSAVLLFPIFGIMTLVYAFARIPEPERKETRLRIVFDYLWKFAASVVICFAAVWALYVPNTMNMPGEKIRDVACYVFVKDEYRQNDIHCDRFSDAYAKNVGGKVAFRTVDLMSRNALLKPFGEYLLGVFMVFVRVAGGNTYYFFGTVSNHATPWYFPAAFAFKETVPFLLLLATTSVYTVARAARAAFHKEPSEHYRVRKYVMRHVAQITMAAFVLLYCYVSVTGNLNIGFRHLFPILPFLYLLVAMAAVDAFHRLRECSADARVSQFLINSLSGILVFWIIAIPVLSYPQYLSYYNEAVGGHADGYKYITDSNYDWGQDLKNLKKWVDRYNASCDNDKATTTNCRGISDSRPIDRIRIDYFGGSSPTYYFGDRAVAWHAQLVPEPGWYAVSATFFQESTHKPVEPGVWDYRWLEKYPMVARGGDSIFIFYVPPDSLPQIPE